jgi:hypothetical protein
LLAKKLSLKPGTGGPFDENSGGDSFKVACS